MVEIKLFQKTKLMISPVQLKEKVKMFLAQAKLNQLSCLSDLKFELLNEFDIKQILPMHE